MPVTVLKQGDKVRHPKRPEWGVGQVMRTEVLAKDGQQDQRIWIRFPTVGLKTVLASVAALEQVGALADPLATIHTPRTLIDHEAAKESGWLGQISKQGTDQIMSGLPPRAVDPFLSLGKRLENTLSLYRFQPTGRGLIEWAVAQSGLDDPLSRFSRHELEQYFQRWRFELDAHLGRLLLELRREPETLKSVLSRAPAAAAAAVRRVQQLRG
ncbi:MAG: DUF3553 domain-containing protein [Phycisphaerales bacterium]